MDAAATAPSGGAQDRPDRATDPIDQIPLNELVVTLDPDQCWQRLHRSRIARVAFRTEDSLEVIPVNYVAEPRRLLFATSSSAILDAVHDGREIVVEVDEHDGWTAWSVVAKGTAHIAGTRHATAQGIRSMLATPKRATVVLEPTSVTGRLVDQAAP